MDLQVNYSSLDRLVHRIAFAAPDVQRMAAGLEARLLGSQFEDIEARRPIFITSLPRAGTTLLLDALYRFPSLCAQTYRDMPFVMAPLLWSRLSAASRKPAELGERAHGDGMAVGYDSPEAFEEVLWRCFWPEKYAGTRIELWCESDRQAEAQVFFDRHMKKVIALGRASGAKDGCYISKNNGNIARLDLIGRMFPEAKIVIPIRRPCDQALSLLKQHQNFTELHKQDPFIRRYMSDLGHYEFGALHKPFAFPGLETLLSERDSMTTDYWLGYWIAAFDHVLAHRAMIIPISYEATCSNPRRALADICAQLDVADGGKLDQAAALFRAPQPAGSEESLFDPGLRGRAEALHHELIGG